MRNGRSDSPLMCMVCLAFALAAAGTLSIAAQGSPQAPGPGLYASWHQPYGSPGASNALTTTCDDTSSADTLYLSFEVPRPTPGLAGIAAAIYFHPQPGDTMGAFWHFKSGWENGGNMWIDLHPYFTLPGPTPWGEIGYYEIAYDHRSGRGRLDIEYVVPLETAVALEPGRLYTFARVRMLHRRVDLAGCAQPICVEWGSARFRYATKRDVDLPLTGNRFVGYNDKAGIACESAHGKARAKPWQPKTQ